MVSGGGLGEGANDEEGGLRGSVERCTRGGLSRARMQHIRSLGQRYTG